jgi:hypothetical protein
MDTRIQKFDVQLAKLQNGKIIFKYEIQTGKQKY